MLEGDVPQDKMTCLFFVKEGIRKLSDLNTVIGNNTLFILIGGVCLQERARLSRNLSHNKIGKRRVRPCPKGQVTVSEQILSLANPAHSGRPMQRTRGKVAVSGSHEREYCTTKRDVPQWRSTQRTRGTNLQYQAHTSKSTAPRKEMCHSGESVPSGTKSAVSWLMRLTEPCTWVARSWVCTWKARSW